MRSGNAKRSKGEKNKGTLRLAFDCVLKPEFDGSKTTSDAGLVVSREFDEALGLMQGEDHVRDDWDTGSNTRAWQAFCGPKDLRRCFMKYMLARIRWVFLKKRFGSMLTMAYGSSYLREISE